jgi:predicted Ser/Thr protein kinase
VGLLNDVLDRHVAYRKNGQEVTLTVRETLRGVLRKAFTRYPEILRELFEVEEVPDRNDDKGSQVVQS